MTQRQEQDLTVRPIAGPEELDLFLGMPSVLNHEVARDLDEGRRQPRWLWVALRGDRLVGRAGWWTMTGRPTPMVLDFFDFDDPEDGFELITEAMAKTLDPAAERPQYIRFVTPDWRTDPETRARAEQHMAVLERTGARLLVERLRLEWTAGTPIAPPSERLGFRPVQSRDELVGLMTRVLDGTLDAHSRRDLTRMTPAEQAANTYEDEFSNYLEHRDWWRIATLADGEAVGFVVPARNAYRPIIAYIGVLPQHRGHGYIDDILAEGTRILSGQGVCRIRAATDVGNVPMAKAFARAGFVNFERQLDMTWD